MGERLTNHNRSRSRAGAGLELARIAHALKRGDKRDLVKDSRLVASLTRAEVTGVENLPLALEPTILVLNHPSAKDTVLSAAHVNAAFDAARDVDDAGKNILWFVAENLQSRRRPVSRKQALSERITFSIGSKALTMMHATYDLLPVPINYENPELQKHERTQVLFKARDHLRNPNGSMTVGMFPEGAIEDSENPHEFFQGIGALIKMVRGEVCVIPTNVFRDEKRALHVAFQKPLQIQRNESRADITNRIQSAIRLV